MLKELVKLLFDIRGNREKAGEGIFLKPKKNSLERIFTIQVKLIRAKGECLGIKNRRRTQKAAISFGEAQIASDPEISEWGNPAEKSSVTA